MKTQSTNPPNSPNLKGEIPLSDKTDPYPVKVAAHNFDTVSALVFQFTEKHNNLSIKRSRITLSQEFLHLKVLKGKLFVSCTSVCPEINHYQDPQHLTNGFLSWKSFKERLRTSYNQEKES